MKIISRNTNLEETIGVATALDEESRNKLSPLNQQFHTDTPCMYKFYLTNKNTDNKFKLLKGGYLL